MATTTQQQAEVLCSARRDVAEVEECKVELPSEGQVTLVAD